MPRTASETLHPTRWVRPLDTAACWARIGTMREGRLRIHTGVGDRAVVTEYRPYVEGTVVGVVITVPAYSPVFQFAVRRVVTLEVDGEDADGGRWTVLVNGAAHELPSDRPGGPRHDEWPSDLPRRHLYVPGTHISGSVAHPCGVPNLRRADQAADLQRV